MWMYKKLIFANKKIQHWNGDIGGMGGIIPLVPPIRFLLDVHTAGLYEKDYG